MQFTGHDTDVLLQLLRWRRDVRHFRPDPIAPALLAKLEQAVALAPSVGNSRPWRVVKVEDQGLRARIIASHDTANSAAAERYGAERRRHYLSLKLAGLREAPVHLAFFTETAPVSGHGLGRQTMPETLCYSTVIAVHSLWLVARSLNLGVGWVSILDPAEVHRCLDAPPHWRLTAYLCLGYPQFDDDVPELERRGWQGKGEAAWIVR